MERRKSSEIEQEILALWKRERIFDKSIERDAPNGEFAFYEGPPTANAPPGIHHVESRTFKDVIPRYKTMRGYRVRRKAGWDTHGLPVELQVEKRLGLKTKKEIEAYGVAKFNTQCRDSVWEFKQDWERLTERIGFWLDMDDPYVTYDRSYTESVWWFLKQAWGKNLLIRDYKIVPWCPRCETPLSSHEVALGYADVEDPSVFVKFEIRNPKSETNSKLEILNDKRVYLLVWTTTPWTLPGNGALAVHPEVGYAVVVSGDDRFIVAKPLVERIFGAGAVIERTITGRELIGLRYVPLYARIDTEANSAAYQVLDADFVTMDDGTGIVHIAPAYGEDDFQFKERGIPPTFSVNEKGIMADGLPGAGKFAKDADVEVIADLNARGLLFRSERIKHTYPFCWRCSTPLLYYARASWYIAMSKLREELQRRNQTINWLPAHLQEGRFGEWLREVKDWAITRERYWGTPLPIWECDACQQREIIGSFAELVAKAPRRNRFLLMRHGEAESNVDGIVSTQPAMSDRYLLTTEGRARVAAAAEQLKGAGITKVIASSFARVRETAEIVADAIGYLRGDIVYDDRLREIDLPDFDGKLCAEHHAMFPSTRDRFIKKVGENETWDDLARRMLLALRDIDAQYEGETILVCSHGDPLFLLAWAWSGRTREGISDIPYPTYSDPGAFDFTGALVNDRGELDVHRPFVDAVIWSCAHDGCGGIMRRFPEVVDVWLDSGCMPFAQMHFPFEESAEIGNRKSEIGDRRGGFYTRPREDIKSSPTPIGPPEQYPAEYIAEAIDQTRGWFYTLLAVATVLGWDAPYRNVISLGHLLDAKGQKMSKSRGNAIKPWDMIEKYGADVVRWYMLAVNQPWDPKCFDEADLKTMANKPFGTLANIVSFWELHGGSAAVQWPTPSNSPSCPSGTRDLAPLEEGEKKRGDVLMGGRGSNKNNFPTSQREGGRPVPTGASGGGVGSAGILLDHWLRARTAAAHAEVTRRLEAYEITEAARAIGELIDDVSTWWLRRSRERLKEADASARGTFTAVLQSIAILLAPFAPFTAERMWQTLRASRAISDLKSQISDSVHLASWDLGSPMIMETDRAVIEHMASVRRICSLALEARTKAGIPVRQALATLRVRTVPGATDIIRDEVNVKEVIVDPSLTEEVLLDTTITPELKREGTIRELTRSVNNLRKEMDLTPSDRIRVTYATDDTELQQAIAEHQSALERMTGAVAWEIGALIDARDFTIGQARIAIAVRVEE
ncbi:MAG: class I tRNA ligase family protein [Candidatus Uhrbacteria bacterium]